MSQQKNVEDYEFDPTANSWYDPLDQTAVSSVETPLPSNRSRAEQLHKLSLMLHQPEEDSNCEPVTRNSQENNHRQFSRCPIAEERTTGILSLNSRSFNCRLVEMSIGGFGVVVAGNPKVTQGAVGSLRAPGLNYVVSVTRQEGRPGGVYIGLKQLEEIIDARHPTGEASPIVGYLIACFSGVLIATASYYFMYGN